MACPQESFARLAEILYKKAPNMQWDFLCFYQPDFAKPPGTNIILPRSSYLKWTSLLWLRNLLRPYRVVYAAVSDFETMETVRPILIFVALLPRVRKFLVDGYEKEVLIGSAFAFKNSLKFAATVLLFFLNAAITKMGLTLFRGKSQPEAPLGKTAVVVPVIPDLSHTFIYREVLQLKKRRPEYEVYGLEKGDISVLHKEASELLRLSEMAPKPGINTYLLTYLRHWIARPGAMARLIRTFQPYSHTIQAGPVAVVPNDPLCFLRIRFFYHDGYVIQGLVLAEFLRQRGIAYVHVYGSQFPAVRTLIANRLLGIRYSISTFVDYDYVNPFHMLPEKFGNAAFVVVCTEFCRRRLSYRYPQWASKFFVLHHSLESNYSEGKQFRSRDGHSRLIYIGRFVPKKGLDVLIKACAILQKRKVAFTCRLYGDGELKKHLENLIELYHVSSSVFLEGVISNENIYSTMNVDDIFVCPSRYMCRGERDGIPVTLLEAMAAGIAVVSTPISGIPELIENGRNGYLVKQNDALKLADLLECLILHEEKRKAVSDNARRTVRENFSLEKSAELLDDWIRKAI